jgi:subtilisin family serine protease
MNRFGALAVDMPTKAIAKLADNGAAKYVSLDRSVSGLGHVESTTGDDAMLLQAGNASLDGSSIGVAILDSGISSKHQTLTGRVVYNRDFTGQGTTEDYYGHGTFVASMIVAPKGAYGGVAPGANLINFRVLDSNGLGKTSAVLSARCNTHVSQHVQHPRREHESRHDRRRLLQSDAICRRAQVG